LSNDKTATDLLASFRNQRPRVQPQFPEWVVAFVLYCLTKAPWEPLEQVSLKRLTLKTFFLILLASGRRTSDVGAIDVSRISFKRDRSVTMYPAREFVPKTRAAKEGGTAFAPIVLPSLDNFVGEGEPDSLLCPVRALRSYLKRTEPFRNKRNRLFLSYQRERRTDVTLATLSLWVKMVVKLAYSESGANDQMLYKVTAHQLRHVSMSLASRVNAPLEVLIQAGMWTNATTFHNFYLADASEASAQSGRFRLGPLVAAQSIV
jgi:integrase